MAKKSYKQHCKSEKVQVGCMSGLMRMLDFRRHPKLISDGRAKRDPKVSKDVHGSIPAYDDKECKGELIFSGRASIKTLMEEEMASSTQPLKQGQRNVTGICFDDIDLNLATSLIEIYRNHSKGQEISNLVESNLTSGSSGKESNTDPSTHIKRIHSNIQKALEDVAEAVIRHQSANTKYIPSSGEARSKEFVDALQLLSSNKELFFMLMQDPSSRLLECLQNLYMSLGSAKLECEGYDGETELQGMTCSLDQSVTSPKVNTMHDIVENPPLCAEIETLGERVEGSQDQCSSEEPQSMNVLPEVPLCSPDDPIDEQENHSLSEVVQSVKPSVLACLCSLENANDREEKLSPQSVLDSVVGDIISPILKSRKQDELSKPTPRVLFKEFDTTSTSPALWNVPQVDILDDKGARVSFIKVVLEASGLLSEEISQRWYTEESLLHVSVLAEVGNLYCLTDDAVLLFDCVEEVLLKIRDNFFGVGPWFAFLKYNVRPTPVGRNLVHEVTKSIDAIVSNEFPVTLDQVIMKDLEIESWMDLRHDAKGVAIELWDGLIDDLLEEMVFDLWL
ncbi:hypothetical protein PR202_gb14718 [Eleusine coracana subsp. coracana]|uniref:DUF4378 domain-containing protein n=1 Tax=Eleusine coracana subsp. coracana TaxID=191504 RepID=A0AAV5EX49_ELECO|nr:hypothetical protein PR202_gb14718 [Eleusine coracana subsp. coracana]